jgi:hypothetical protein
MGFCSEKAGEQSLDYFVANANDGADGESLLSIRGYLKAEPTHRITSEVPCVRPVVSSEQTCLAKFLSQHGEHSSL